MQKISVMKTETAKAKHKPKLIFQILIFAAVFMVTSALTEVFLGIPMAVWLFQNEEFIKVCTTLDFEAILNFISNMPTWLIMLQLVLTVFEIIVPVIYCTKIEKRSLKSMGFIKKNAAKNYLIGLIFGAALISLSLGITYIFGGAKVRPADNINIGLIIIYFLLYMIQGAAEEVMVRGYLMMSLTNGIRGKHNELWAILLSAIVFGVLHLGNPGISLLAFVNLILCGITFGVLVMRTDNLFCACAFHTAWNFVQGNIFGVLVSGMNMNASVFVTTPVGNKLISGGSFGLEGGIGVLISNVIAIAVILILFPKKEKEPEIKQPDT